MTHTRVELSKQTLTRRQSLTDSPPPYLSFGVFFDRRFLLSIGRSRQADHRQTRLTGLTIGMLDLTGLTIGRLC
jgi:hypothetical protein